MNLLLIGADQNNPTDGVIVQGIHHILKYSMGEYNHVYKFLDDHIPMEELNFYPDTHFDAIIVCGTPWLWDSFQKSIKYANLCEAFRAHPKSKRIFFGIGSCLPLDAGEEILERPEEVSAMEFLFKDALMIVRDNLAYKKLQKAKIQSHLLPCPAYLCYGTYPPISENKTKIILIGIDPLKSISWQYWKDTKRLEYYKNKLKEFFNAFNPDVYCASINDTAFIENTLKITPIVLNSYKDTLDLMKTAKVVYSSRVHCAVPASVLGATVILEPLDTRAKVFYDFSIPNTIDLANQYKNIINEFRRTDEF